MDDKSLYAAILGVKDPWGVEEVELHLAEGEVHIWVALPEESLWVCPECVAAARFMITASGSGGIWTPASTTRSSMRGCPA